MKTKIVYEFDITDWDDAESEYFKNLTDEEIIKYVEDDVGNGELFDCPYTRRVIRNA
jgi:hypothetical protein